MQTSTVPLTESDLMAWTKNFASALVGVQVTLGITMSELEAVQNFADNLEYLLDFNTSFKQQRDSFYVFKREMIFGAQGPMPEAPSFTSVSMPGPGQKGGVEMLRVLVRRIRASAGYTQQIGELLGIEKPTPPPPDPMLITPTISAVPMPDGKVQFKCSKMGMDAVRVEYKLPNVEGWNVAGEFTTAKTVASLPDNLKAQPERVLYRARLLKKNEPVGQYSSVISVITNP
jgi:hypothetical protein